MKSIFDSQVRISFQLIIPSQGIAVTFSPKFARGVGAAGLLLAAPPRDAGESTPLPPINAGRSAGATQRHSVSHRHSIR